MKKGVLLLFAFLLTACVKPEPYSINERYSDAQRNLKQLFTDNTPHKKIDFYEALAHAFKYNLDYRVKLADMALQTGQLALAEFAMYPQLNTTGSLYSRQNDLATINITDTGNNADSLSSTPRTLRSARIAMSWNILDFGMGYVRAKQQSDRVQIAKEQSRKQLQQLTQDMVAAYWEAYSAQELLRSSRNFQEELINAKNNLNKALSDPTIPRDGILQYEEAVLQGNRQMIQLQNKYDHAMINLKRLTSLPLDHTYLLEKPPSYLFTGHDLSHLDFKKLDAIALVNRPELISQGYQQKIAQVGVKAAVFQALPGITMNYGWNYNSNQYLLNNKWMDRSLDVAWNLLNLASLPTAIHTAKDQIEYEKLKMMALTLTVLTETRFAYSRYQNLYKEYQVVKKQEENARAMYTLTKNRWEASLASNQQVILAKLRLISTKMDENVLLADMSTAVGLLYLSAGFDILPLDGNNLPMDQTVTYIKQHFGTRTKMDFKDYVNETYHQLFSEQQSDAPLPS